MLSLDECRRYLSSDCTLTDKDLELLRDQLYGLADISINLFLNQTKGLLDTKTEIEKLDGNKRELWEERAAIMEFDDGMTRSEAENVAFKQLYNKEGDHR